MKHILRSIPLLFILATFASPQCIQAQEGMKADSLMKVLSTAHQDSSLLRLNLLIADDLIFANPDTTEFFLERAFILAENLKDSVSLAKIFNLKGILHSIRGRLLSGLEFYQQSLHYYEALNDEEGASKCINNIGTIYSELGNNEAAIAQFKDSYKITTRIGKLHNAANNLFNISSSYISLKELDSAMHYAEKLQDFQRLNKEIYIDPASLLGNIYLEQGQLDSALFYYKRFYEFVDNKNDEHFAVSAMTGLANVYRLRKNYPKALTLLMDAENRAKTFDFKDLLLNICSEKAKVYEEIGNFTEAYKCQLNYQQMKDSLDLFNNSSQINELNARYESAKREKEIIKKDLIISEQEASRKAITVTAFLIILSVLLIAGIVAYFMLKGRKTNKILHLQNKEINKQRHKIISSINYAKKIQNSILIPEETIKLHFPDSFVYFKPRDIVSGDFYWFAEIGDKIMLSTIDCTGHGVPGAFMSLIANAKLNKVVNEKKITNPCDVLNEVHREIIESLNQETGLHSAQDGMDMSLCLIDKKARKITFAGAQNSIFLVQGESLEEIKADALSIGGTAFASKMNGHNFSNREIRYDKGAYLFLCTDGMLDQFGGELGKKFNKARFRKLLLEISEKGITHAKNHIDTRFDEWRNSYSQLDDILIIGAKL